VIEIGIFAMIRHSTGGGAKLVALEVGADCD